MAEWARFDDIIAALDKEAESELGNKKLQKIASKMTD